MPVWVSLEDAEKTALHTETFGAHTHLITEDHSRVATQFKTVDNAGAVTNTVVSPKAGGAIVMTDIVFSGERTANGIATVRFSDGSNTVNITKFFLNNNSLATATSLQGLCLGWEDARIEVDTDTNGMTTTATIWYYFVKDDIRVKDFAAWDADR